MMTTSVSSKRAKARWAFLLAAALLWPGAAGAANCLRVRDESATKVSLGNSCAFGILVAYVGTQGSHGYVELPAHGRKTVTLKASEDMQATAVIDKRR